MAEQWGLPYYTFLLMPHPTANLTEAELNHRAEAIAPEVVKLLLQEQAWAKAGRRAWRERRRDV